jgi:hypothetical protein
MAKRTSIRVALPLLLGASVACATDVDPARCDLAVRTFGVTEGLGPQRGITAIGRDDGRPFVAVYADQGMDEGVWAWSCQDPHCAAGSLRFLGLFSFLQDHPVVMLRANGRPLVIAEGGFRLDLFDCEDADCQFSRRLAVPGYDSSDGSFVGFLGSDGLPRLFAGNVGVPGLVMYVCGTPTCGNASRTIIEDGLGGAQYYALSLSRGPRGEVLVAHTRDTGALRRQRVLVCDDDDCEQVRYVDPSMPPAATIDDVAMLADGRLVLLENEFTGTFVSRLRRCSDAACAGSTAVVLPVPFGDSLRIDPDGRAMVGFGGFTWGLVACNDAACSAPVARVMGSAGTNGGAFARLALNADGQPMVAAADRSGGPPRLGLCPPARILRNGFEPPG